MEKQKRMAMQNAVEELARKQVERGRALAEEGMKYIKNPKRKPLTPAEARMYIVDGSELERIGYGLTDERRQREPHTIQVIISAPRPGKPISEAPQRRELPAGDTTNEKVLEAEVVEVNTEEFA
jgi:hypothetical protein